MGTSAVQQSPTTEVIGKTMSWLMKFVASYFTFAMEKNRWNIQSETRRYDVEVAKCTLA